MRRLLDEWLANGLPYLDFWEYDLADIDTIFKGVSRQKEREIAELNKIIYNSSALTAAMVGHALSGKKFPAFETVFPDTEKPITAKEKLAENVILKEKLLHFADRHNAEYASKQGG